MLNAALYRYHVQKLCKEAQPKIIVEVGVYCADLSRCLVSIKSVENLYLVDNWNSGFGNKGKEHMEWIYNSVVCWSKTNNKIHILREDSINAAKLFEDNTIDFLHLDAGHTTPAVLEDLKAWVPKIKIGGLITGDNYEAKGVAKSVNFFFKKKPKIIDERLWYLHKST